MAIGDATAADVPSKYDVIINGKGYVFADSVEPNLPFRSHRAIYDITQTFLGRSNVTGNYGDNFQDFFLTGTQKDWSLGEQKKFMRVGEESRYWAGAAVDVSVPGQVSLRQGVRSLTFAAAVMAGVGESFGGNIYVTSATNLYKVDYSGGITDKGAHGLGAAPGRYGVATDGDNIYISGTDAGTVGVRLYNFTAFSTFSATPAISLEYLNNTLYGIDDILGTLIQYDSAGTATTVYTWRSADGDGFGSGLIKLKAFGGELLILRHNAQCGGEVWTYDGIAPRIILRLPPNFMCHDMEVMEGVIYVSGSFLRPAPSQSFAIISKPAIFYLANGQIGQLWQGNSFTTTTVNPADGQKVPHPSVSAFDNGIVFNDDIRGQLMFYNPATGGVHSIGGYTVANMYPVLIASQVAVLHTRSQTAAYMFPDNSTFATTGYVATSLFDFDNSLTKMLRGITVDFDLASDGNGGSVDIAYQVNSIDGSYTNLQTGATSGTEYKPTSVTGKSFSIKITLNKGTSTAGPVLKRISMRAAPQLTQFRSGLYVLDLANTVDQPRELRDGTNHPLVGFDQATNLFTAARATAPFNVTDKFGTFTALIDLADPSGFDIYEVHPSQKNPNKPGSYLARIKVREV